MPRKTRNKKDFFKILGWVATVAAVFMYISYVPQIFNNLNGHKSDWMQPLAAAVNCSMWVYYALFKEEPDLPVAFANAPGIICGLLACLTAIF